MDQFSVEVIARIAGGAVIFDLIFNVEYPDAAVQAAIAQAMNALSGAGANSFVWRRDGFPSYHLACVADAAIQITEVVCGAHLLLNTARQILLYPALGLQPPAFFHCPLMTDEAGVRLAKRHDALSLRALRTQGKSPESLRRPWPS